MSSGGARRAGKGTQGRAERAWGKPPKRPGVRGSPEGHPESGSDRTKSPADGNNHVLVLAFPSQCDFVLPEALSGAPFRAQIGAPVNQFYSITYGHSTGRFVFSCGASILSTNLRDSLFGGKQGGVAKPLQCGVSVVLRDAAALAGFLLLHGSKLGCR